MATATLQTITNRILDELSREGDLTSQAHLAINSAIDYYKNRPFWFNEELSTNNTQADTEYYELPSDYGSIINLTIDVNNNEYPLIHRTFQTLDDWFISDDNYTGFPTDFAIFRNQLRLYPIPNDAYTLRIAYRKGAVELSADGDTNVYLTYAEELIRRRAEKDLCASILQDVNRASTFAAFEIEIFKQHQRDTAQKTTRGKTRGRSM